MVEGVSKRFRLVESVVGGMKSVVALSVGLGVPLIVLAVPELQIGVINCVAAASVVCRFYAFYGIVDVGIFFRQFPDIACQ